MNFRQLFPATSWVGRVVTHRIARRIYLFIVLLVLVAAAGARVSSLVQIRRIHRVLAGLQQVQIDHTTEAELLRTVPYLQWNQYEWREGSAVHRAYYVVVSNERQWLGVTGSSNFDTSWRRATADWIGFRYLDFRANVVLLDGKVSKIAYGIQFHPGFPRVFVDSVYVTSFHGIWAPYEHSLPISSADDESPQYHIGGNEERLAVSYAFDAPPNLVSHAFSLRLACMLSLRSCRGGARHRSSHLG
jgi:hypothetical protein